MAGRRERVQLRDEQLRRRPGGLVRHGAGLDAARFVAPVVGGARHARSGGARRRGTAEQHRSRRRNQEPGSVEPGHPCRKEREPPADNSRHSPERPCNRCANRVASPAHAVRAAGVADVCYRHDRRWLSTPESRCARVALASVLLLAGCGAAPQEKNRPDASAPPSDGGSLPWTGSPSADAALRVRAFQTRRWRRRPPSPTPWRLRTPSWPNAAPVSLDCFLAAAQASADGARRRQHVQLASFGRRGAEPARVHLFGQPGHVGGARRRRQPVRRAGRVHQPRPLDQGPARVPGDGPGRAGRRLREHSRGGWNPLRRMPP